MCYYRNTNTIKSSLAGISVQRRYIGTGEDAAKRTMSIMSDTVRKSSEDYYVRRCAELFSPGKQSTLENLWNYLVSRIKYVKDIDGLETLQNPKLVLERIDTGETPALDCDCMTVLILSLARSLGFKTAIRSVDDLHVYGLVLSGGKWVSVDLTKPEKGLGWEYSGAKIIVRTLLI